MSIPNKCIHCDRFSFHHIGGKYCIDDTIHQRKTGTVYTAIVDPEESRSIIRRLRTEGQLRLFLYVGMPYGGPDVPGPNVSQVQGEDSIYLRPSFPHEFEDDLGPAAVCQSCESMNVTVALFDDAEIELHRKIHEAITRLERF